jgi:DDE superfamily endonuclease
VLLSQDEARFAMVPTLVRTLGLKGERPVVGTRDDKDLFYVFASLDLVTGRLVRHGVVSERRQRRREGTHKTRRLQHAFARHLDAVARAYPAERHARVVLTIDNAPWHAGEPVKAALARHPHLELYRLPSYSPQLNVIERLWKVLRTAATHNRLFAHVHALAGALDRTIRRLAARRRPLLTLILSARKRAKSSAA